MKGSHRVGESTLAKCPFCNAEISEHLAVHGGTCPSCFGQVPGEEAPTDPGAVVRARQEKEDAKTVQRSRLPLVIGVMALVGLIAGAGWIATRPAQEVPVLDFDQLEFAEYEFVIEPEADTEVAEPSTAPRPIRPRPSALEQIAQGNGPDIQVGSGDGDGVADAGPGGTRGGVRDDGMMDPQIEIGGPSFGGGDDLGVEMGLTRGGMRGVEVCGPEIITVIRRVMEANIPRLQTCYTRQLKTDASLRGDWMLGFTTTKAGDVEGVTVTGQGVANAELESCIQTKVERWVFQPICEEQEIRKTLRFRAR